MNPYLQELEFLLTTLLPDSEKYRLLSALFHRFINEATSGISRGVELRGPFAKTDYLLKERNASPSLRHIVHEARNRFRSLRSLSSAEMAENFPYDLEAVARLVALVEGLRIPLRLRVAFPKPRPAEKKPASADAVRFIVDGFDDSVIFATSEADSSRQYRIEYTVPSSAYPYDRSYLRDILFQGAQINVIRPRIEGATVYPELIVFEPDLLMDVSAVAACFETYAADPRVSLLKRISPAPAGDPINLGNFAGQLLDEEIHSSGSPRTYAQSAQEFFRNNALALAAVPPRPGFHNDARLQQRNIRNALRRDLPGSFSGFDLSEVMVEPSFFSEMLGLQGRMDFLQLDMRVLVEQKSGKGEFPFDNFLTPRHREQHYVQLLLYMLIIRYNYPERYRSNNLRLDSFLLYSKYERSLLPLGFSPALVFEALKIRNMMAARDISYAEEGVGFLADLDPDSLKKKEGGVLWERFIRPQLASLLSPIRAVPETDRRYYLRFMRFLAKEHLLAKVGNRRKENSGFAATWLSPLEEKIESGNIYTGLRMDTAALPESKIQELLLHFTEDERNSMANFRTGDVVILYSYPAGSEPDARRNMVFRASVAEIRTGSIRLRLCAPQSSRKPFLARFIPSGGELLWAIEHDYMESSFTALYRGMHSFLSAPAPRRDLLMHRRPPEVDSSLSLRLDHGVFNDLALRAKRAGDLFLILGPPGTGKTSFGLMTSIREELSEPGTRILLLAYTNRAVDEICAKLSDDGIKYIRLGSEISCSSPKENLLSNRIAGCRTADELHDEICSTRVIAATTTAVNASPLLFRLRGFSLAVIDEASQILEPHIIGLLSAVDSEGKPAIRRFIMIGDHKQLPAVVGQTAEDSAVEEPELKAIRLENCADSLFERLIRCYGDDPRFSYILTRQGRMHEEIAEFPNREFYGGLLKPVPLPHQILNLPPLPGRKPSLGEILSRCRVAFLDIRNQEHGISDKVNLPEARMIASLVGEIYRLRKDSFDPEKTVGVIVPYRNQIAAIRKEVTALGIPELTGITIDTIERYQGSQRKFIIYGFTVSRPYQLGFLSNQTFEEKGLIIDRKLNVAMTRAEEHLLLVGNAPLLESNIVFRRLLTFLEKKGNVFIV
ncbi:MAG: AAA family ATPase [Muribaculaceae bacterium]|nr:AAA family ATPase [Muribaculaceae bacterium]